jgi:hypothetical protein
MMSLLRAGKLSRPLLLSREGKGTEHPRWKEDPPRSRRLLELVRLGVKRPNDPGIRGALAVVVQTLNGTFRHRYNLDGYGEELDGDP